MKVKLDEHQLKAVKHFGGPALVVAGPGSGKTTVIKDRILNLIREHNVDPERILAIAFTDTAAKEMDKRLKNEPLLNHSKSKICTLHVFGKDLITENYAQAGFKKAPNNIWDANRIGQIINEEKYRLKRETSTARVAIYKFEGITTGRCYIGQTTDPERREQEHRTYSSNRGLREALQRGDEKFEFKVTGTPMGKDADTEEESQINIHRNRAVVILDETIEQIEKETADISVTIYKIKSKSTVTCYFGLSTDLEQSKELHFTESPNDSFRKAIENEDIDISSFKVIAEEKSWADASSRLDREVWAYKKWAVFNDEDPLHARDSTRRRIEVFCKYFDVPYEEVLDHTHKFGHEMQKFDDLKENIEKAKRRVSTGLFKPKKIGDPILRAFATRYEDRKTEARAIDFQDMLIRSAYMLEENPELLNEYREKYRYVFVDEFQDISPADFRLIKLFPENLFAVGDDDQAIYGFRGGDSNIMQKNFGNWENLQKYEITRNYRSRSDIVLHSKALIENNECRISKDLRSDNSEQALIAVQNTPKGSLFTFLFKEISGILTSDYQKVGILARNWKREINKVQEILDCSEIRRLGYEIKCEKLKDSVDEDVKKRQKMFLRKGSKEIEVINIYAAKGREWDKVILLVNTQYDGLPRPGNDITEERRIFYVAVTRAKHELVIFDGGNCEFVSEFQKLPYSERKKQLAKVHRDLLSAFGKRLNDAKEQLQKVSETLPAALNSQRARPIKVASQIARRQHQLELTSLQRVIIEAEKARKNIELELPEKLKIAKETFLKKLIPILDQLESVVKNVNESVKVDNPPLELVTFCENIHSTQEQFLDLLKNYGLKPIETLGRLLNLDQHEEVQSRIYSDEVPKGNVVKEIQQGYILNDQVIRKAQVVVSKGERQSEWFINLGSAQPMCFVTNHSIYTLQNIRILDEIISGVDSQGSVVRIQKPDMLFAFPKRNWDAVKPQPQIVEPTLQRNPISDEFLRSILVKKEALDVSKQRSVLRLVTKAGYVLKGYLQSFDKDVLYMSINKKVVAVFRHGLLEIFHDSDIEGAMNVTLSEVEKSDIECTPKAKPLMVTKSEHSVNKSSSVSQSQVWDKIAKAYANGTPINGYVIQRVKGGLRVRIEMLHGFLPASQVDLWLTQNLDLYVGKTFEMKITEFNKQQDNLVLSRRAWLEKKRSEFLETLEIGQQVTGIVKNITTFGAFVDLGGIDGLIHKTELGWKPIDHPSEVISVGDEVEIKVIEFNREDKKISLSLKQMTSNPWEDVEDKYPIGSTVQGTVVNIVHYGAFLQLEEGVVGLLHVSEMSHTDGSIATTNFLNEGDEVKVVVLEVSKNTKRISLSMKQTQENRLQLLLQKYPDKPK